MKMSKILAAGIAATLAVTSLASVTASAEELTFNMARTYGTVKFNMQEKGLELGDKYYLTDEEYNGTNGVKKSLADGITERSTNDKPYDDSIKIFFDENKMNISGDLYLSVTGVKGTRGSASKTYKYKFEKKADDNVTKYVQDETGAWNQVHIKATSYTLPVYKGTAPLDGFLPEQFLEITALKLEGATASITVNDESLYNKYGAVDPYWGLQGPGIRVDTEFADANNNALLKEIQTFLGTCGYWFGYAEKSAQDSFAFLPATAPGAATLLRNDIKKLSSADEYAAGGVGGGNIANSETGVSENQSYGDDGLGKKPVGFAGLASQVGDFFNKQTNGTITFTFTLGTTDGGSSWNNGGVPSTQVGIKDLMSSSTAKDFALFFNYTQTGSLQATTLIDKASGSVTFDISDVLDALDGKTIGVIDNIYYGMTKGVDYDLDGNGTKESLGLLVEKITLAYDEDAADDTDIEEDDDDATIEDDDDDSVVEDDDDATIEDDDDDAAVEDDDDADDDTDVDGDVDEPVTPADDDDDANPGTGVALAVVPALVAAAAVVVSKKRK